MSKRFLTPINVLNAASDPVIATEGDVYYNTTSDKLRIYINSSWSDVGGGVTSLTGTSNEIEVSASTGAVQVGLPNSVRIESLSSGTASVDVGVETPLFVAVSSNEIVSYSTNGINWTQRTLPISSAKDSITYGNGVFLAIGRYSPLADISTNGISWTQGTLPSSPWWKSVSYGNGLFVVIAGYSNFSTATYSTNGVTWTQVNHGIIARWQSVTYGNNVFVAVANNTYAMSSTNGATWTRRTLPVNVNSWSSITYGNNNFVAVAGGSSFGIQTAVSTNGITWTQGTNSLNQNWSSVAYGNGVYVAVPINRQTASSSTDGITWTTRTLPVFTNYTTVTYGNGLFVALAAESGVNVLAYSTNGITWTRGTMPSSVLWRSVAYGTPITPISTPLVPLPTQTGNSGKYLTTNGTTSSWGTIDLSGYQPLDGDLTSIAGLSASAGLLRKTDLNTFTLDTATYLTGNQTVTLSGDATGSGSTSISLTLANSGVSAATYGSASAVPTVAIDVKGRVTSASATPIVIAQSAVTNLTTDLALKANLASPTFTGTPAAPTAAAGTNTTQVATTAFVQQEKPTLHPMFMIGGV